MIILSKNIIETQEILKDLSVVAWKIGAQFSFDERVHSTKEEVEKGVDLYISKHYESNENDPEYFWIGIESMEDIISTYDLFDFKIGKYYRLAVTDQAEYPRLMYDFAVEYLRLNPDHIISMYGDYFFNHDDMEKLKKRGGYYEDWCYGDLPWQGRSK